MYAAVQYVYSALGLFSRANAATIGIVVSVVQPLWFRLLQLNNMHADLLASSPEEPHRAASMASC